MYSEATPSFALMDIQGPVVVTYVYQLVEGEVRKSSPHPNDSSPLTNVFIPQVKVDKVEYRRPDPPAVPKEMIAGGVAVGAGSTPVMAGGPRMMSPGTGGSGW